ncbi:MAG: putative immunity protein [Methanomassiliicoccales archaeon]
MAKPRFVDHPLSADIDRLARSSDHRALALWAAECAERVLPLFEKEFPEDDRPRLALVKLREWVETGEFHMAEVRRASLNAHAAARSAPDGSAAQFAARACGQAMATAHVKTHSIAAAWYAVKAVRAEGGSEEQVVTEREWQLNRLTEMPGIN